MLWQPESAHFSQMNNHKDLSRMPLSVVNGYLITAGNNLTESRLHVFQQILCSLLFDCLQTLCILVSLINASPVINIGLIYANTTIPKAPDFLQAGLHDVSGAQPSQEYQFRLLPVPSMGCFKSKYKSNDAAIIAEMYYENGLQMLFGPACDSDLNIVGRLTKEWNILQFNFRNEYFDNDRSSVVQTSTISSLNAAFNLVAFFKIMSWDKVVLIWSVIAFDDENTTKLKIANIRTIFKLNGISLLSDIRVNTTDVTRPLVDVLMGIKNTSRIWIPIFGYYLHDYIEFLEAVKQLSLDPTVYVIVLLDFFVLGEFKPPWILPNNGINETMKFYFDGTIIASFLNDLFKLVEEVLNKLFGFLQRSLLNLFYLLYYLLQLINNYYSSHNLSIIKRNIPAGSNDVNFFLKIF
uniref:ANF_receptor domain-containing protein n=1 Tax=Loa loa TaxID=7209 RepID=A0A1I7VPC4_LOALO